MTILGNVGRRKVNSGFALITVLVVMLVAILLGVSASQLSVVDERVSGNYRAATLARFAAEYGAAQRFSDFVALGDDATFKDKVEDKGAGLSPLPPCNGVTFDGSGISISEGALTGVSGLQYDYYECQHQAWNSDYSAIEDYYAVKLVGVVSDDTQVIATDELINAYRHEYGPPFDGNPGILGCNVENSGGGQSFVVGSVHANCVDGLDVTLSKQAVEELYSLTEGFEVAIPTVADVLDDDGVTVIKEGFLTKFKNAYGLDSVVPDPDSGDWNIFSNDPDYVYNPDDYASYAPGENPVAAEDLVYENISSPFGKGYVTCTLDASTPLADPTDGEPFRIYYCPEEDVDSNTSAMTVSSTFRGDLGYITMISEDSITFGGAGGLIDGEIGMSVIAAGNIRTNGSQDQEAYGLFWADGDIVQNGKMDLNGSMVSSGTISFNGNFDFDGGDPINNSLLNLYKSVKLFSWSS